MVTLPLPAPSVKAYTVTTQMADDDRRVGFPTELCYSTTIYHTRDKCPESTPTFWTYFLLEGIISIWLFVIWVLAFTWTEIPT